MYIIFSDVDGTIYGADKKLLASTIKDIQKAQDRGIEFVMTTGNAQFEIMERLAEKLEVNYIISSNGARIYDVIKKENLFETKLPQKVASSIFEKFKDKSPACNWWDETSVYYHAPNKEFKRDDLEIITTTLTNKKLKESTKVEISPYKIEFFGDEKLLKEIKKEADKYNLKSAIMFNKHIEITNRGVSKGEAVKFLTKKLGASLENIMTIGDSQNDISMLEITEQSYAMANADRITKDTAKRHASAVEQNGLGEAIEDYIFRNKI